MYSSNVWDNPVGHFNNFNRNKGGKVRMIKVGVIGIGSCGSQIAVLANKTAHFPAVIMNSSQRDIDAVNDDKFPAIVFGTTSGAGKNRDLANDYLQRNIESVLQEKFLKNVVENNDLICIITSTGGGTGSGTAPMLADILDHVYNSKIERDDEKKMFINVGVLPSIGESIGAQRNTKDYLEQLIELRPDRRYMLFDNNRVKGSMVEVNETVNNEVVEALRVIRGDYSFSSKYSMIDENDTRKIITTPGMIFIDTIQDFHEGSVPVDGTLEDVIIDHINKENCCVKPDRNHVVKYMGFISCLEPGLHQYFDENLPKIRQTFGEPTEDFRHFAVNEDDSEGNRLSIILSGMSAPENRINEIRDRIKKADAAIVKRPETTKLSSMDEILEKYDGNKVKKTQKVEFDLDSIMGSYRQ